MKSTLIVAVMAAGSAFGAAISLSSDPFAVTSLTAVGNSFVYTGTLTGTDTIAFQASGTPCLQPGDTFCTNAAGVVVVAGSTGVGGSAANGATNFGSLLISISGVGSDQQVFATNAANGLGSLTPPTTLALGPTALSTFFGAFSVLNPTITFTMSDTFRDDNSGGFSLSQVPEPGTLLLSALGVAALALGRYKRR